MREGGGVNEIVARESTSVTPQGREVYTELFHQFAQFFILDILIRLGFRLSCSLMGAKMSSASIRAGVHSRLPSDPQHNQRPTSISSPGKEGRGNYHRHHPGRES